MTDINRIKLLVISLPGTSLRKATSSPPLSSRKMHVEPAGFYGCYALRQCPFIYEGLNFSVCEVI